MLDFLWICNTSHVIWSILTCQALVRKPFPRQKGRYYFGGDAQIENLPFPLPDAFRHQSEVSGASLEKTVECLDSFSGAPQASAESRFGSLFQTPYFLGCFVNVPKRKGDIAF